MWRGRLFGGVERASKHKTIEKCDLRMQPVEKRYFYSCKTSSFVLFSTTYIHAKKKRCFKSNQPYFVGGTSSRGQCLARPSRPRQARPVVCSGHGAKPDRVRQNFQCHPPSPDPGPRNCSSRRRLPGLAPPLRWGSSYLLLESSRPQRAR